MVLFFAFGNERGLDVRPKYLSYLTLSSKSSGAEDALCLVRIRWVGIVVFYPFV